MLWLGALDRRAQLRGLTSRTSFQALLLGAAASVAWIFYPLADALKLQGLGQDQDDCLISGSQALLRFSNPYLEPTYFGNPCSPLPGAILPYLPFVAVGIFSLAGITFVAVSLFLVGRIDGRVVAGLYLSIIFGTPLTLELLVNGSDFILMGFGLVVIGLLMERIVSAPTRLNWLVLAIVVGLISSTRVNMPILLLFFVAWALINFRKQGLTWAILSIAVALGPALVIFLADPDNFTPFHLVGKGQRILPSPVFELMLFLSLMGVCVALYRPLRKTNAPRQLFLVVAPSVLFLAYGDLASGAFNYALWGGASYLMVVIPISVLISVRILMKLTINPQNRLSPQA